MKEVTLILRFVVIGLIYIILFRLIRIMLMDFREAKHINSELDYALEVVEAPDLSGISIGNVYLVHEETSIGRKADNQVVINDPFVSGTHAAVFVDDNRIYIRDIKSTNGTILNGEKIGETKEMKLGDTLEIGRVIFKIIG